MKTLETNKSIHFYASKVLNVLFLLSFLASIVLSIAKNKETLIYTMPVVISCLILTHVASDKQMIKWWFVLGLCFVLVSDILIFSDFKIYFIYITIFTSLFLICCIALLKNYLNQSKFKTFLSPSVIISFALVGYVVFYTLQFLIENLPNNQLFFAFCCIAFFIVFFIAIAVIYLSDDYKNGFLLLIAGISYFFQMFFSVINEFLHFQRTITVLIIICHVLALYLLNRFFLSTNPSDVLINSET